MSSAPRRESARCEVPRLAKGVQNATAIYEYDGRSRRGTVSPGEEAVHLWEHPSAEEATHWVLRHDLAVLIVSTGFVDDCWSTYRGAVGCDGQTTVATFTTKTIREWHVGGRECLFSPSAYI